MHTLSTLVLALLAIPPADDAPKPSGVKWVDMDYGPTLATAIDARRAGLVYKGLVIPFDVGDRKATMLFDMDLLRFAAGWTDGFIDLEGIVFNGTHGTFPAIEGELLFHTKNEPGWARLESFADPREHPFGPLPKEHADWRGHFLHGERVALHYTVGRRDVIETPSAYAVEEALVLRRTLWISPHAGSTGDHLLRVASGKGVARLVGLKSGRDFATVASLPGGAGAGNRQLVVAMRAPRELARLELENDEIRARVLADKRGGRIDLFLFETAEARAEDATDLAMRVIDEAPEVPDTRELREAGAARFAAPQVTRGQLDIDRGVDVRSQEVTSGQSVVLSEPGRTPAFVGPDGKTASGHASKDPLVIFRPAEVRAARDVTGHPSLVARFELDAGTGDSPENEVAGGPTMRLLGATWRRGLRGRSIEFNGTTEARVEGAPSPSTSDVTVAAWVATHADGPIVGEMKPEGKWIADGKVFFLRGGRLAFDVGWVGVVGGGPRITDGRWHHVAFTWRHEEGAVSLYVDGKRVQSGTLAPKQPLEGSVLRLGHVSDNFPGAAWWSGKLDGLRIYRQALVDEEIAALFERTSEPRIIAHALTDHAHGTTWRRDGDNAILEQPPMSTAALHTWTGIEGDLHDFRRWLAERDRPPTRPFVVDRVTWPEDNPWRSWMRFGGVDLFDDGKRAALTTWSGDVWIVDGLDQDLDQLTWRRFATGLNQPLGLEIVDDEIYALGRDQITRLHDTDGDGEADHYESFHHDYMNAEHFHEPAMDLRLGDDGDFYFMKAARHAKRAQHPHHGTLLRVSRDGRELEVIARGFRASNGLGVGPGPTFWGTDQEGYWMPANRLSLVKPGGFHGNVWAWFDDDGDGKPDKDAPAHYEPPLCWLHPSVDRSPAEPLWLPDGALTDLGERWIQISYGNGKLFLVLEQDVDGTKQGFVTELGVRLPTGVMRGRVHPATGDLYVAGLVGWSSDQTDVGGFYRVRRTSAPLDIPVGFGAHQGHVVIDFDKPVDVEKATDVKRWSAQCWEYRWTEQYGSPDFKADGTQGRDDLPVESVRVEDDGRRVVLEIPNLRPTMQLHVRMDVPFQDGTDKQTYVHGTIHALGDG